MLTIKPSEKHTRAIRIILLSGRGLFLTRALITLGDYYQSVANVGSLILVGPPGSEPVINGIAFGGVLISLIIASFLSLAESLQTKKPEPNLAWDLLSTFAGVGIAIVLGNLTLPSLTEVISYAGFVLAVISIVLVFMVDRSKKPTLDVMVHQPRDLYTDRDQFGFYHIDVTNKPSRFVLRDIAHDTQAQVQFFDRTGNHEVIGGIIGKWANKPNPTTGGQADDTKNFEASRIDIGPGVIEMLDIVMKPKGQSECYAHGVWSWVDGETSIKFRIDQGEYLIRVTVKSSNCGVRMRQFLMTNEGTDWSSITITNLNNEENRHD